MPAADSAYAPLTAALIRRAPPQVDVAPETFMPAEAAAIASATWRDDLRLFVVTWAFGFVFFLAFIG